MTLYTAKIVGGYGKVFSPVETAWGHYAFGVYHTPEQPNTPFLIVSNGTVAKIPTTDARMNGILGTASLPVVLAYEKDDNEYRRLTKQIDDLLSENMRDQNGNIHQYLRFNSSGSTGETPLQTGPVMTLEDAIMQTWPVVQNNEMRQFRDLVYQYFVANRTWLVEAINEIQQEMTVIASRARGVPRIVGVGYGMYSKTEDGLKLNRRPSRFMRFGKNLARIDMIVDPFTLAQERSQAPYMYMLAYQIRKMIAGSIKGFDTIDAVSHDPEQEKGHRAQLAMTDFLALANALVMQVSGSGDINIKRQFTADDIMEQILSTIGIGFAEAYPFMPFESHSFEEFIEFAVILGIVAARVKATVLPVDIVLHSTTNIWRAPADFERYSRPNLESFGSLGTPWYPMARNYLANDFPFFSTFNVQETEQDTDRVNLMEILMRRTPKFSTAEVTHGEVTGNLLDPLATEAFIKWNIHPDVRRWEVEHTFRILEMVRFPLSGIMPNENLTKAGEKFGLSEEARFLNFFLAMLSSGRANLKEGYFVAAGMGLTGIQLVKLTQNLLLETTVIKSDTKSTGEQEAKPESVVISGDMKRTAPPPPASPAPLPIDDKQSAATHHGETTRTADVEQRKTPSEEKK